MHVRAPGVSRNDLRITCNDNVLKVEGETKTDSHTHFVNWTTDLRRLDVDVDKAVATAHDGIVAIEIPKKAPIAPKRTLFAVSDSSPKTDPDSDGEDEPKYTLTVIAPGFGQKDLTLEHVSAPTSHEHLTLKISGESARTGAKFVKHLRLPRDAAIENVAAWQCDGVLTVVVPKKKPEELVKHISVVGARAEAERDVEDAVMV